MMSKLGGSSQPEDFNEVNQCHQQHDKNRKKIEPTKLFIMIGSSLNRVIALGANNDVKRYHSSIWPSTYRCLEYCSKWGVPRLGQIVQPDGCRRLFWEAGGGRTCCCSALHGALQEAPPPPLCSLLLLPPFKLARTIKCF